LRGLKKVIQAYLLCSLCFITDALIKGGKMVKVIVIRAAGTNCDKETVDAFIRQGAEAELVHINQLKNKKKK